MKSMSNAQYSAIKRILATFAEIKIEGSLSVRTLNQQRIAKKLLIKILRKFKYVKELDFYWHSTHKKLHALQSRETKRKYELCYDSEGVSVDMGVKHKDVHNLETYTYCTIKVFPYGDDTDYAELCANELLDKLNEEV